MTLKPNMGPARRAFYVLAGAGLVAAALFAPLREKSLPVIMGVLGVMAMVEGAAGF